MMKKLILIAALAVGMSGMMVKKAEASCSQYFYDINFDTGVGDSVLKTSEETGGIVCGATADETYMSNSSGFIYTEWTCQSDGSYTVSNTNCKACIDGTGCTDEKKCSNYLGENKTQTIKGGEHGCADSTHYGVCDSNTGSMISLGSCGSGNICENDFESKAGNDGHYGSECVENPLSYCKIDNVNTLSDGEKKCIGTILYTCTKGTYSSETCSSCINDPVEGATCAGTAGSLGMCIQIPSTDGSGTIVETLNKNEGVLPGKGRGYCYQNYRYTCDSAITFTLGDKCTGNTPVCYRDKTTGEAVCGTQNDADENGYVVSDTVTSKTSVYNPLCDGDTGINTAFGCISFSASGFAAKFLQLIFGIAGGVAFLLMVYGFILVATSSGDEKKLQGAKETITSAITGLLVCIFALLLFRIIAVNILQIPGIS